MALPSLVTKEAAAVATAPVSASPDVNHDVYPDMELFDEPWAALHNRQIWHTRPDGTNGWRNDATGFSFDE